MKDWFYSKSTDLYVCRKPLKIDARVKEAAEKARIKLDWNDEGIVNNIDFDDANLLMAALGSKMFTPVEYWLVLEDAKAEGDLEMVKELASNRYAEWLNRVYFFENKNKTYIDAPEIIGNHKYEGKKKITFGPVGKPGWFNPEGNINSETGEPIHMEESREKFATSWKYWSPDIGLSVQNRTATAAVRGYVVSVGKPAFDLGIPTDTRYPNLAIRECRYRPLEPVVDAKLMMAAEKLVSSTDTASLVEFVAENGEKFAKLHDLQVYKLREKMFDVLGYASLHSDVSAATKTLCHVPKLTYQDFKQFLTALRDRLKHALKERRNIVFVMGHKNPDTDTVVSSLFEAYRNHLLDGDKTVYVPVVQSSSLPAEVSALLGELSPHVLFSSDPLYLEVKNSGLARWISVDQNTEPEVQKYFVSIIDHHYVSEFASCRDVPKTLEYVGSCTALIALKYLGMGVLVPRKLAQLMYGATLMDTENRIGHKMTRKDFEVMDYLKTISKIKDDKRFYRRLMAHLLATRDVELLFRRDYKEDWGFGFAVVKTKGCFFRSIVNEEFVSKLRELAKKNNLEKNLPLTLLRITDYRKDNETINRERIYIVSNKISENFVETVKRILRAIIQFELPDDRVSVSLDHIDFWGSGKQLSRKKTAPVLEPIVGAFNRYFYSPSIKRWVKRDFLKLTGEVKAVGNPSTDEKGRVNYVTFGEAKEIARNVGFEMLSINEYWKVLADAKRIKDVQMIESLQAPDFLEFWDTAILKKQLLIDHPTIQERMATGKTKKVTVPAGTPGLIHPSNIDAATGLPTKVLPPNEYDKPELWRYWEPDADLVFPCRSYIFLLKQPSWDGKFHLNDSFPNLGIRPAVKKVKDPIVNVKWNKSALAVNLIVDSDEYTYRWPKREELDI